MSDAPKTSGEIRAEMWRMENELSAAERAERGVIAFQWGGADAVAEPIDRPYGRLDSENYWDATVGNGKRIRFRSSGRGGLECKQWDVSGCACGAFQSSSGESWQEAADRFHRMIAGYAADACGFLGVDDNSEGER